MWCLFIGRNAKGLHYFKPQDRYNLIFSFTPDPTRMTVGDDAYFRVSFLSCSAFRYISYTVQRFFVMGGMALICPTRRG